MSSKVDMISQCEWLYTACWKLIIFGLWSGSKAGIILGEPLTPIAVYLNEMVQNDRSRLNPLNWIKSSRGMVDIESDRLLDNWDQVKNAGGLFDSDCWHLHKQLHINCPVWKICEIIVCCEIGSGCVWIRNYGVHIWKE